MHTELSPDEWVKQIRELVETPSGRVGDVVYVTLDVVCSTDDFFRKGLPDWVGEFSYFRGVFSRREEFHLMYNTETYDGQEFSNLEEGIGQTASGIMIDGKQHQIYESPQFVLNALKEEKRYNYPNNDNPAEVYQHLMNALAAREALLKPAFRRVVLSSHRVCFSDKEARVAGRLDNNDSPDTLSVYDAEKGKYKHEEIEFPKKTPDLESTRRFVTVPQVIGSE